MQQSHVHALSNIVAYNHFSVYKKYLYVMYWTIFNINIIEGVACVIPVFSLID